MQHRLRLPLSDLRFAMLVAWAYVTCSSSRSIGAGLPSRSVVRLIAVLQTCMNFSAHPGLLSFLAGLHNVVSACQSETDWLADTL